MPNPWDATPFPAQGDPEDHWTYEGVGRVMSQWERLELELADLYSIFVEQPYELSAVQEYGKGTIFGTRLKAVEDAAESYFQLNCNQNLESRFGQLMEAACGFSGRRNDVAHGIVRPSMELREFRAQFEQEGKTRYVLVPHIYTHKKYDHEHRPAYCYTSNELHCYAAGILDLSFEIGHLRRFLYPEQE